MIGIDIEKIDRFRGFKKSELNRIFTKNEIDYANKFADPFVHFAGMWCSKEAFIKCVKNRNIPLKTIEILHTNDGCPYINVSEDLEEYLIEDNCGCIDLSISHTDIIACAIVEIV